ncbi:tetraacyldisaccharide 4'-kinase [Jejudonia soesokkakensis]|uniref:Tetraacyldisaccharide 4'-kinase n=1 Tax=Jejudonia soesokkakensis TaxID=1323432 RepID=A0ABW2MUU9_9FLAO
MKFLRKLLFPFAILYGIVTAFRNYFYNVGWFQSKSYRQPVICVGNLSVGGTGKSPMVAYLLSFLKDTYKVAVLSRGYKRETSGYIEVTTAHSAKQVGDEPRQCKQNFPEVTVAVCANRQLGMDHLLPEAEVVILDDAFQHRKVKASLNILLTPFDDLYIYDYMLPTGNLREPRAGMRRADIIVVTKCPEKVAYSKLQEIQFKLDLKEHQRVYFSKITYASKIYNETEALDIAYLEDKNFSLVTGIANPKPLVDFLAEKQYRFEHLNYPDHHDFTDSEIETLKKQELILTTEKDYMRLQPKLGKFAVYYLPIKTEILNDQGSFFEERILQHIKEKHS